MVFILNQELSLYKIYQQQICSIDQQIEECLTLFESKTDEPLPQSKKRVMVKANHQNLIYAHTYIE